MSIDRHYISNTCYSREDIEPEINIGTLDNPECIKATSKKGQKLLLENLASKRLIPINDIYAPKQYQSNCWFNTMFMVFFVSDKGRKFFKFFRELMIKGRQLNGNKVRQPLHNALLHLNIYIDAVLSGESRSFGDGEIDTNTIIEKVYNSIPKTKHLDRIAKVGDGHNPLRQYRGIMKYLGNDSLPYSHYIVGGNFLIYNLEAIKLLNNLIKDNIEMIILEIHDVSSRKNGKEWERKNTLEFSDGKKFVLDSIIIRDTLQQHFCCLMTYNNKECGFDGVSYRRLSLFHWNYYLNKDKEWSFQGSNWKNSDKPIKWNFKNGYQILYYYRVK